MWAEESRREIPAPRWSTKLRKEALKTVGREVWHHWGHPFLKTRHHTAEREGPCVGEWSEHPALPWTQTPGLRQWTQWETASAGLSSACLAPGRLPHTDTRPAPTTRSLCSTVSASPPSQKAQSVSCTVDPGIKLIILSAWECRTALFIVIWPIFSYPIAIPCGKMYERYNTTS